MTAVDPEVMQLAVPDLRFLWLLLQLCALLIGQSAHGKTEQQEDQQLHFARSVRERRLEEAGEEGQRTHYETHLCNIGAPRAETAP